jgi:hypothetical protein
MDIVVQEARLMREVERLRSEFGLGQREADRGAKLAAIELCEALRAVFHTRNSGALEDSYIDIDNGEDDEFNDPHETAVFTAYAKWRALAHPEDKP